MLLDQRELKRRLMLRLKSIQSEQPVIGPASVQLYVTNVCNLSCRFCVAKNYDVGNLSCRFCAEKNYTEQKHLSFDRFSKVVCDCLDLEVDQIILSGAGEPTLNPDFYEMLSYLRSYPISVALFSNGTFPFDRCKDILKADRIMINLGEANRASYRMLHGRDLFLTVIKNIRELAKLRAKINPNFKIEVIFVENALNTKSFLKTKDLVRKLGADSIHKKRLEVAEYNQRLQISGQQKRFNTCQEWTPCFQGWFSGAIRLSGDVNVCCYMDEITLGNAYATSFKEVWESKDYSRVRFLAMQGDEFRNHDSCKTCVFRSHNKQILRQIDMFNRIRTEGRVRNKSS